MDGTGDERWPDKGLWIYPELLVKAALWFLVDSGVGFLIIAVLWWKYGALPFAIGGAIIGWAVVWRIFRRANRHHPPVNSPAPTPES